MTTRHFRKGEITKAYNCEGDIILATIEIGGNWISNPTVQMLEADGWEEYIVPPTPPYEPTRSEKIHTEIRTRYSDNEEYMVLRHYASDPVAYAEEFREYNEFVESVIAKYPEEDE